jgi:hypothetical protein
MKLLFAVVLVMMLAASALGWATLVRGNQFD